MRPQPGIWLMKKAVRENIEFITDRKILNKGFDTKTYQYSLVNVSFNNTTPGIVNHFNISTIKKRIIMMNAKRSSRVKLTRYAFVVPTVIALLLVFTFSKAEITKPITKQITDAIRPVTAAIKQAAKDAITGADTILVKEVMIKPAKMLAGLNAPAQSVYIMSSDADTGKKIRIAINSGNHKGMDSLNIVLNGKKVDNAEFSKVDPGKIVSVNIVSAAEAKKLLAAEDNLVFDNNKSIVFVNTSDSETGKILMDKLGNPKLSRVLKIQGGGRAGVFEGNNLTVYEADTSLARKATAFAKTFKGNTIYRAVPDSVIARAYGGAVNGTGIVYKRAETLKFNTKLSKLDTVRIAYTKSAPMLTLDRVYRPADAATLNSIQFSAKGNADIAKTYREVMGDGELFLTTKSINRISDKMVVIDGKEATESDMKKISAFDIDRVEVRSDAASIKKHGTKAKNGVVYIYTKKAK